MTFTLKFNRSSTSGFLHKILPPCSKAGVSMNPIHILRGTESSPRNMVSLHEAEVRLWNFMQHLGHWSINWTQKINFNQPSLTFEGEELPTSSEVSQIAHCWKSDRGRVFHAIWPHCHGSSSKSSYGKWYTTKCLPKVFEAVTNRSHRLQREGCCFITTMRASTSQLELWNSRTIQLSSCFLIHRTARTLLRVIFPFSEMQTKASRKALWIDRVCCWSISREHWRTGERRMVRVFSTMVWAHELLFRSLR